MLDNYEHEQESSRQFFDANNFGMHHSDVTMHTPSLSQRGAAQDEVNKHWDTLREVFITHPEPNFNGSHKYEVLTSKVWINEPIEDAKQVVQS